MKQALGYARVSTVDQNPDLQVDELTAAGCHQIFVERAEEVEDELSAGAGGVQLLVEAAKADAVLLETRDDLDEVPQGSSQTVESPDDQGIPRPEAVEGLGQLRTIGLSAGGALDEDLVAAGGGELVDLEVGVLIDGRDSRVAEGLLHGPEAYQNPTAAWWMRR
jgi:hypothetical protein